MLRAIRITKPSTEVHKLPAAIHAVPAAVALYVASVASQYQNQGLSLAELVAAGEEGWQQAQQHYGAASEQLDRWGAWWVKERILQVLENMLPNEKGTA